jgi:hypothetical protein
VKLKKGNHFITPWLAKENNIEILIDAINSETKTNYIQKPIKQQFQTQLYLNRYNFSIFVYNISKSI